MKKKINSWINKLETFELMSTVGFYYVITLLLLLGILISIKSVITKEVFNYGMFSEVFENSQSLLILFVLFIMVREFWLIRKIIESSCNDQLCNTEESLLKFTKS